MNLLLVCVPFFLSCLSFLLLCLSVVFRLPLLSTSILHRHHFLNYKINWWRNNIEFYCIIGCSPRSVAPVLAEVGIFHIQVVKYWQQESMESSMNPGQPRKQLCPVSSAIRLSTAVHAWVREWVVQIAYPDNLLQERWNPKSSQTQNVCNNTPASSSDRLLQLQSSHNECQNTTVLNHSSGHGKNLVYHQSTQFV